MSTDIIANRNFDLQEILDILNGNSKTKKQSTVKSLRLDRQIVDKIDQQAKNSNTSLNAEINYALKKYVEWDMLAIKVGMIPIAKPIVSEMFQRIMTKEQIIDLANVAKKVICEAVLFMKGNLTLESFLSWLIARIEHSNVNYIIENTSSGPQIRIVFKHDMGENWSVYHKLILEYIFHEILGIRNVWVEVLSTTFVLCFK